MHINSGEMHSDLDQSQRDEMMYRFKSGQVDVLVATDIVARGITQATVRSVLTLSAVLAQAPYAADPEMCDRICCEAYACAAAAETKTSARKANGCWPFWRSSSTIRKSPIP